MKNRILTLVLAASAFFLGACQTPPQGAIATGKSEADVGPVILREGDTIRVTFPGSPNLDSQVTIRRDGRITLPLVGEYNATGKTPADLEKALLELFGPQLVTKEIQIVVVSSVFPVYLNGAVARPGKITSDRPLTALEAIMEAGGFDYVKADLVNVTIIRNENGQLKHYKTNLKAVLEGTSTEQFFLRPSDIVFVPERFSWL